MSLEKVLRLAAGQQDAGTSGPGDDLRVMVQALHLALSEACETGDPVQAAELVYAAAGVSERLSSMLFTESMPDWVEATAGAADGSGAMIALGGDAPYGNVTYADTGLQGDGKKRYPVDTEEHVRAAWGYINKAKNAAKYTAGQLATIKGKIKGAMKSHGIGANVVAASATGDTPVMAQLRDGAAWVQLAAPPASMGSIPMHHAPFNGKHSHPHKVTNVHDHEHQHMGDNQHDGMMHGNNAGQKAWAAQGGGAGAY